jgi:hypothetical protein
MTDRANKAKRWRPSFSVRTLVIVVTLVCCYAACWGPTKRRGVEDVQRHVVEQSYSGRDVMINRTVLYPLILQTEEPGIVATMGGIFSTEPYTRCYYFWFFGYVAKLPWETELPGGSREARIKRRTEQLKELIRANALESR